MVTNSTNLNYFLREMERQYPNDGPQAARLRLRIAKAAARGARRGRKGDRYNGVLAGLVLLMTVIACVLAADRAQGCAPIAAASALR